MHSPIFVWMGPTRFFPVRVNTLFLYSDRSIVSTDVLAILIVAKSRNPHRQLARSWQRMNAKHVRKDTLRFSETAAELSSLQLKPDGTESQMLIERLPEAELGTRLLLGSRASFPRSQAWDMCSANFLTSSLEKSRFGGCLFYRFDPRREHIEEKAGRDINDLLVTQSRTIFWRRHEAN